MATVPSLPSIHICIYTLTPSLCHQSHFYQSSVQELFFVSPKKRFVSKRGNPFWELLYLEFKVRNRFVLSCFLSVLSLLFEFLSWPSSLKLCAPRTLDSFLMVHSLPLKPRVRIIYFTTLLDYKLLEDKDWGINPCISPEGTVTYSRGPKWEQHWITM